MNRSRSKIRTRLSCLCSALCHRLEKLLPPERQLSYDCDGWSGSVSALQGNAETTELKDLRVRFAISPERIVSDTLYAPEANGCWVEYPVRPLPQDQPAPSEITDPDTSGTRPLVFDHFFCPATVLDPCTAIGTRELSQRIRLFAEAGLMLRHKQPCHGSQVVEAFLARYPDIPQSEAWLLQPTFLAVHVPFKHGPFCIWIDQVRDDALPRLFSQALTQEGYPVGAAQSRPINTWTNRDARLDLSAFGEAGDPC
ncbi:hypothetical protein [uncultured Ruegeria sp.]|uniref:hypothetical protein n=1 Tax=uncultured Ruegeria sp. TaxID=259304 RepID=UPI00262BDFAF|nr:hypothetical protein [uncultured Ruegeria sp.]